MRRMTCINAVWQKTFPTVCAVILTASLAFAGSPKLSKEFETAKDADQIDVIVQFKASLQQKHYDKINQHGGSIKNRLGCRQWAACYP